MKLKPQNFDHKPSIYPALGLGVVLLVVWEIGVRHFEVPNYLLPTPSAIALHAVDTYPILLGHLWVTLLESVAGFVIGAVVALVVGAFIFDKKRAQAIIYPLLLLTQSVPTIAIAPLIIVWFGFDIGPKIALIASMAVFPMLFSFLEGIRAIDKSLLELLYAMRASRWAVFFKAILPASLSSFFAGAKIAAVYCVSAAISAEWLGGKMGIGIYMTRALGSFETEALFVCIVAIAVASLVFVKVVDMVQRAVLSWENTKG